MNDSITAATTYNQSYFNEQGSPFRESIEYKPIPTGQTGKLDGHTAVFYPESFDPAGFHFPALVKALDIQKPLEDSWRLEPSFASGEGKNRVAISTDPSVNFYGTGEVAGPLERTNTTIELWTLANTKYEHPTRNYQAHPYVMGVRTDGTSFGIIACSTYWGQIEIHQGLVVFTFDGPAFPVLIFEGNSPQAVVEMLGTHTGTTDLPPKWSIGFHQCKFSYYPQKTVLDLADEFRSRGIPCDTIWLDIHYMKDFNNFTIDEERFPDAAKMTSQLADKGFKTVWIIDPYRVADEDDPVYQEGLKKTYWMTAYDGTVLG